MEDALLDIIAAIKAGTASFDASWLDRLVRRHSRMRHAPARAVAKRQLLPYYLDVRAHDHERWLSWDVDPQTEEALVRILKMKPRRTASGVATITVITKPWPCTSDCLYCPNDVRMPKSYLAHEPACQRAEHNYFDPYLQVKARLHALEEMGHVTDKIELIVLGGTWNDYPDAYQRWFVRELFRAVNDQHRYVGGPEPLDVLARPRVRSSGETSTTSDVVAEGALEDAGPRHHDVAARSAFYAACGLSSDADELEREAAAAQLQVDAGHQSYNQAVRALMDSRAWRRIALMQQASWEEVEAEHHANEHAARRVVGLVIETRPDLVSPESARTMRRLGCTKVQIGIQSLDDDILKANHRHVSVDRIAHAFAVLRAYGFKIHVHFMANLLGSTPASDKEDYLRLITDPRFLPDEVKLYPCALVGSSRLMQAYDDGRWQPYTEEQLVDVLATDVLATPPYVRISRMIRDISARDIVAGNKKTNLRQMVEAHLAERASEVREIRMREIATDDVTLQDLHLDCVRYATATSDERFLQWVTEEGRIAGFCRLSLPDHQATVAAFEGHPLPTTPDTAMLREVHVYGRVSGLGTSERGAAQHSGLGKALVEEACMQAQAAGFARVAVISSIGTRAYYRHLGFEDAGLYQIRTL